MKTRKPLRRRSKKRAAQERVYHNVTRPATLSRDDYLCRRCCGAATEVHHMAGRTGERLTDVNQCISLCRSCHVWVTEHPRLAVEQGFSVRRVV